MSNSITSPPPAGMIPRPQASMMPRLALPAAVGRSCGPCLECCRIPAVAEVGKPAGMRCMLRDGKGCRVYSDRPPVCRNFSCLWLAGNIAAPQARPDLSGIIWANYVSAVHLIECRPFAAAQPWPRAVERYIARNWGKPVVLVEFPRPEVAP